MGVSDKKSNDFFLRKNTLIASVEKHCEEAKVTLETQITSDEDMLSNAQTKLGSTTKRMIRQEISSRGDQGDEAL